LLFEADELRFLSAGADQKLLSTHARGRLEAEDRGRGANHTEPITALVAGPVNRFFSGSSDSSLKSWPRAKGARPVTLKFEDAGWPCEGASPVVALTVVQVHGRHQIVAACRDNSLRFFHLDEESKFGDPAAGVKGVEAWAQDELVQADARRREAALQTLAGFADAASVKLIATQMTKDVDHGLRLRACQLLGEMAHPHAAHALEKGLQSRDEAVRVTAFEGLRRHAGPSELRPMVLALQAEKADVGQRAVAALEGLAAKDDQAMARLVGALEAKTSEVRRAALASLEKVHPADSPEASLTALNAPHADLRRLALLRLFQRRLLHDSRAQAALRWRGEDQEPEVRRVAFLLSLYTREKLLRTLRKRDPELQRQLTELESGNLPAMEAAPAAQSPDQAASSTSSDLNEFQILSEKVMELADQGQLPALVLQQFKYLESLGEKSPEVRKALVGHITSQIQALAHQQTLGEEEE
jgi:ParB family chromosome partitioning protein